MKNKINEFYEFMDDVNNNFLIKELEEKQDWDIISECCKSNVSIIKNTTGKGLYCYNCRSEVFATIDKEYYKKLLK